MTAKIIKALGVSAALGIAAMPLTTFAVDPATGDADVSVTINPSISMTLDTSSVSTAIDLSAADITTMKIKASVSTNARGGYTLELNDQDTDTALRHETLNSPYKIDTSAAAPTAGTSSWAVKGGEVTNWTAMPASNGTALTLKSAAAPTNGIISNEQTEVTYGVASGNDLASGTYSDTVVYTATAVE